MATADPPTRPLARRKGRGPFSNWMKRLEKFKRRASTPADHEQKAHTHSLSRARKHWNVKNNPYPESSHLHKPAAPPSVISGAGASSHGPTSPRVGSFTSYEDSASNANVPVRSNKSAAPTLATNAETIYSDVQSKTGTSRTGGAMYDGRNSTFSSPQNSSESLTTTLTTIQSTAPSAMLNPPAPTAAQVQFSHQYPISPTPASAIPSHLAPTPHTFGAATANGVLSDDASIMTLASSSKRRRRNSLDTNASVRALAPSSLWGNSRESLPLSVLSSNVDRAGGGLASAERASIYSSTGVNAPMLISERNSYYSVKQGIDSMSIRSGLLGHGRTDSINGSISGLPSPLATSPRDPPEIPGRSSRRTGEWKDGETEETKEDEDENTLRVYVTGRGKEKARD
ncbi:hypothetical protein E2P81_ATG01594 [Venturia nashicola]|uniref:Uncharacterized protein n=1 Tax=Venturia nashicola TaxID=86259 RepID=A0A4Z1NSP0_9PEZI|nr:hypothetical protein E6O75_ATG01633 [Venturia nashicola]TLD18866.1 hypothetical protein E2P81_ATG01594 [Venturia nashicola]